MPHLLPENMRHAAMQALENERRYQNRETACATRPDMVENLSIGDHLLAMEHCLSEARVAWYSGAAPHRDTLDFVRKVGALALRCMEMYGVPERNGEFTEVFRG